MKTSSSLVSQSRIRRSATRWRDIIRQYKQSGQTQAEFCNGYSLALSTFSRWHQRLTGHSDCVPDSETGFIELSPHESPATDSSALWDVELQLGTDMVLRLRHRC